MASNDSIPQTQTQARAIVLVIEDEPLLLMLAVTVVEDAGFEALIAGTADEAMEILACRTDVRILFTDIDVPGTMNGLALAATVRDRWPPIGLIVVSGKFASSEIEIPSKACFFAKPYDARHVAEVLHRMAA